MLEQGDLVTLEDNKEYVIAATTTLNNIVYVYLIDQNDYSNFMFCSYDQTDGLYEIEDKELLQELVKIFTKQLTKFIDTME